VAAKGLDLDRISRSEIIFSSPLAAFLACSRRLSATSSLCLQPTPNRYKRERQAIAKGKPEAAGTEQEFSSSYEHLEGDTTGVVDPDVSFEAYF